MVVRKSDGGALGVFGLLAAPLGCVRIGSGMAALKDIWSWAPLFVVQRVV